MLPFLLCTRFSYSWWAHDRSHERAWDISTSHGRRNQRRGKQALKFAPKNWALGPYLPRKNHWTVRKHCRARIHFSVSFLPYIESHKDGYWEHNKGTGNKTVRRVGSNCSDTAVVIVVFWIGGRLWEVVVHWGSTIFQNKNPLCKTFSKSPKITCYCYRKKERLEKWWRENKMRHTRPPFVKTGPRLGFNFVLTISYQ